LSGTLKHNAPARMVGALCCLTATAGAILVLPFGGYRAQPLERNSAFEHRLFHGSIQFVLLPRPLVRAAP